VDCSILNAACWPPAVSLKIAFLPLLAFELTILVDNLRMCRALMPGDDDSITDDAIWEALPVSPLLLHKIFEGLSLRLGSAALGLLLFDFAIF
jgi:hypothetical protein